VNRRQALVVGEADGLAQPILDRVQGCHRRLFAGGEATTRW
jgi:hypothetical protein